MYMVAGQGGPSGVGQLAIVNVLRTPGRTALGALTLAIGVCALTLLLAATVAFNDVLVGTLLGGAVAVQARNTDYVAVLATVRSGSPPSRTCSSSVCASGPRSSPP
jgi:putative ABC transport system permease protein